jgi:perosamine synthetase
MLPLAKPAIGAAEIEAQSRALASGQLVLGAENLGLEAEVARIAGVAHAVAVASGTCALHAALWSLDLPRGGEVIVPAYTFPAPANVACALGLEPVAVDVDEATWNLDPQRIGAALTPRTVAIVAVDQFGLPANWDALEAVAEAAGVPIIQDAACAIGAVDQAGRPAGSRGALGCFSFHPRKVVTTGEGGAITCASADRAAHLRRLRHHGIAGPGLFPTIGLNFRLAEPAAAIGRVQLGRLPALLAERRALAMRYRTALLASSHTAGLGLQADPPDARRSWQTFAVLLPEGVERAKVQAELRARGIESGPATFALHRLEALGPRPGIRGRHLPVANALHERALALPLWNGMDPEAPERVAEALAAALAQAAGLGR